MRKGNRYSLCTGIFDEDKRSADDEYIQRLKVYNLTGKWPSKQSEGSDDNVEIIEGKYFC